MIINFVRNLSHEYVNEDGIKLPIDLIRKYPHEINEDGHGFVNVPVFTPDGEVRLVGIVETELKATEKCVHGEEGELVPEKTKVTGGVRNKYRIPTTSGFTLELEEGENTDFGAEPLEDLKYDDVFVEPALIQSPMKAATEQDFFEAQGRQWLHVLGFVPRPNTNGSVHRWYHPMLGDDKADNWLLFDVETDGVETLGVKIYRLGCRLGTRGLKLQIKAALEQH